MAGEKDINNAITDSDLTVLDAILIPASKWQITVQWKWIIEGQMWINWSLASVQSLRVTKQISGHGMFKNASAHPNTKKLQWRMNLQNKLGKYRMHRQIPTRLSKRSAEHPERNANCPWYARSPPTVNVQHKIASCNALRAVRIKNLSPVTLAMNDADAVLYEKQFIVISYNFVRSDSMDTFARQNRYLAFAQLWQCWSQTRERIDHVTDERLGPKRDVVAWSLARSSREEWSVTSR